MERERRDGLLESLGAFAAECRNRAYDKRDARVVGAPWLELLATRLDQAVALLRAAPSQPIEKEALSALERLTPMDMDGATERDYRIILAALSGAAPGEQPTPERIARLIVASRKLREHAAWIRKGQQRTVGSIGVEGSVVTEWVEAVDALTVGPLNPEEDA